MQAIFYHEQSGQTKIQQMHELKAFPVNPLLVFNSFKLIYKGVACIKLFIYNIVINQTRLIFFPE